jgi:hypothetical protein
MICNPKLKKETIKFSLEYLRQESETNLAVSISPVNFWRIKEEIESKI